MSTHQQSVSKLALHLSRAATISATSASTASSAAWSGSDARRSSVTRGPFSHASVNSDRAEDGAAISDAIANVTFPRPPERRPSGSGSTFDEPSPGQNRPNGLLGRRQSGPFYASSSTSPSEAGDTPSHTSDTSASISTISDPFGDYKIRSFPAASLSSGSSSSSPSLVATSRQAHNRFCRARKQVRSQMLITSSILEGSGVEDTDADEATYPVPTWSSHLQADSQACTPAGLPLPLRAHARFRDAFHRMRNQMLITSRLVETGDMSCGPLQQPLSQRRGTLSGIQEDPTVSLSPSSSPMSVRSQQLYSGISPSEAKGVFDASRPRCMSIDVNMGQTSVYEDIIAQQEEVKRRNSLAGFSSRTAGARSGSFSRRSLSVPTQSLESYLKEELRMLIELGNAAALEPGHEHLTPPLVQATVSRYLQEVKGGVASSDGWNLCLEALYSARQYGPAPNEEYQGGNTHTVASVYDLMLSAGERPTGWTYSVVVRALCARAACLRAQTGTKSGREADQVMALLERALATLRTATIQHPRYGTHPDSPLPFVALLDSFAQLGMSKHTQDVVDLWTRSAAEAELHRVDGRAHAALIQSIVKAAEQESPVDLKQSRSGAQYQTITHLVAVQKVAEVLQSFERGCETDAWEKIEAADAPFKGSRIAHDLLVYNAAIEGAFRLGYPDRGVEIFERLVSQCSSTQGHLANVPLDASTISALLVGLLYVGEPTTAVKWIFKIRQHNPLVRMASTSPVEMETKLLPEPSNEIVIDVLEALINAFPSAEAWQMGSFEVETTLQAFLDFLPIIRDRAETSPTFSIPAQLSVRVSDIIASTQRVAPAPSLAPTGLAMSQPMTPSFTHLSSGSSRHGHGADMTPPLTPLTLPPSPTYAPVRALDVSLLTPLNMAPPLLPPVQKIDPSLSRRLEASLRTKKGRGDSNSADVTAALVMLRKSVVHGVFPDVNALKGLIMACGRSSNTAHVREVYGIASTVVASLERGSEAQTRAWYSIEDAVLSALAHTGDSSGANAHRNRLLAAGGVPSANSYAALIAMVKDTTDDAQAARDLWQESRRLGVVPNIYLYNAIISKLSRARKAYPALQLFEEMRKPPHNLQPTSVTYGAVINACVRGGDAARAKKYFAEMEADPCFVPRPPAFNCLSQFFTYAEPDRAQALLYYEKMRAYGVLPSAHTYKLLLDVYGTIQPVQPEQMEAVFQNLVKDPNVEVNGAHWASLIQCYGVQLKDVSKAIEIFKRASANGAQADPIALEALMLVFFESRQPQLMRQYIEEMRASGTRMTAYICNLLIKGYALDGHFGLQAARDIFAQMQDPPAGVAAAGNHAPRAHGAGARRGAGAGQQASTPAARGGRYGRRKGGAAAGTPSSNTPAQADSPTTTTSTSSSSFGATSFDRVHREPSTYESMIRAELYHGETQRAQGILAMMETRGFPPALLSRTRTLLDEPRGSVLTACLKPAPRAGEAGYEHGA